VSVNVVIVTGTLAREPRMSYQAAEPEARLDIRCLSLEKDADGKWRDIVTILPVVIRGRNAERTAGWLKEGMPVEVEGQLRGFDIPTGGSKPVKACAILARRVERVKTAGGKNA
jgi:single-stranded DNA-binding protein